MLSLWLAVVKKLGCLLRDSRMLGARGSKFRELLFDPRLEALNTTFHPQNRCRSTTAGIMRGKRSKAYKKLMGAFHQTFGFREPYQVLCAYSLL